MMPPTPAQAYWNQRHTLAGDCDRIMALLEAVNHPTDLVPYQWAQLMSYVLEFQPDVILELGRGSGNSTCAFTEAAHLLGSDRCRVVSLCLSDTWDKCSLPWVRQVVSQEWLDRLRTLRGDILGFDFKSALAGARKVLVFWDAHGFDVADCVLGRILPEIAERPHAVLMHDLSDGRHNKIVDSYGQGGLWKGASHGRSYYWLGHINTNVAQAICAVDFTTRNRLTLDSADHSYHLELVGDANKLAEMHRVLGDKLFSCAAHWFWFTLNERPGPYTFPHFDPRVRSHEYQLEQQRQEVEWLRQQAEEFRQQAEEFRHQSAQLRQEQDRLRHEYEQFYQQHVAGEAAHTLRHEHQHQQIVALQNQRTVFEHRVGELCRSRWRRLGRKIGIAKKASWE